MDRPSFFQSCISFTPTTPAILRYEFLLNQQVQVVLVNNETTLKTPNKKVWNKKEETAFEQRNQSDLPGVLLTTNCSTTNSYKGTNQIHLNLPTNQDVLRGAQFFFQHFKIFLSELRDTFPSPSPWSMSLKKCCWDEVIRVFSRTMTGLTLDLCLTDFGHQYVTNLKNIKRFFCLHHHDQLECYISVSCVVPPYHTIISL